ncbi:MAG: hypothetical protein JXO72_09910 [Vicinamibacteria bacterium]|nr:hypothetical protein [Vicinamibacteria bacterium]
MKKLFWYLIFVLVVAGGSFLAGYLSEHKRRAAAENEVAVERAKVQDLEAQSRMWVLEDRLLMIMEHVQNKNYGLARDLSSPFFEELRREATRTPREDYRAALDELHARRDAVTAALTVAEPGVVSILRESIERLRRALGRPRLSFAEPPRTSPSPEATPTPMTTPTTTPGA